MVATNEVSPNRQRQQRRMKIFDDFWFVAFLRRPARAASPPSID
jgi:hypothetical protein